ncbi:hypothetical protein Taro_030428, partial [Colocasia esculenta]|nr:hypothetical protein [Colocasia esculenta]
NSKCRGWSLVQPFPHKFLFSLASSPRPASPSNELGPAMAQALALVPQEHGHGGPSIMDRFKRMAPPSFKGKSQPFLAKSYMREVEKIFRAIRCAEGDKVSLATYMLQVR